MGDQDDFLPSSSCATNAGAKKSVARNSISQEFDGLIETCQLRQCLHTLIEIWSA